MRIQSQIQGCIFILFGFLLALIGALLSGIFGWIAVLFFCMLALIMGIIGLACSLSY